MKTLTNNNILYAINKLKEKDQQLLLDNFTVKALRELFSSDDEAIKKYTDTILDAATLYAKVFEALVCLEGKLKDDVILKRGRHEHCDK